MAVSTIGKIITGNKAVQAQTHAADQANDTQKYMYDQTRADQQPWRQAGERALGQMQDSDYMQDFSMADFTADPGYAFRMAEGAKALERSAAARGGLNSGGTLKALTRYSQGVASDEFTNAYNRFNSDRDRRFNRLSSLAGVGQTANSTIANAGQNYANQVSANQIGVGNARGANYIAQGNAIGEGIQNGASMAMFAMCDERLKTNIEPVSKADLNELKANLKAFRFKYKNEIHGKGDFIGVMAQDLEKSKLGKTLVFEDASGFKRVDLGRVMMLFLATLGEA